MERLQLSKIVFGKTDAFNELLEVGTDFFTNTFVENDRYQKDMFLEGKKYYICGKKGTGKTAFLRYLECNLSADGAMIVSLRFKSDIDDYDKEDFVGINAQQGDSNTISMDGIASQKSYVLIWETFLINQIIQKAKIEDRDIFIPNSNYKELLFLLAILFGEDGKQKVLMPRIKKGEIELGGALLNALSAKMKIELDFKEKNKRVSFPKVAKRAVEIFKYLQFQHTSKVFVLLDELELSVRNKEMNKRDIILVRDLILAIDELNKICQFHDYYIRFISSIRTEVINSVQSVGFEINKCVEDYGILIDWQQRGGDYKNNYLLKIIENRIHESEKQNGLPLSEDVWANYFVSTIQGHEVRRFILNNTWYRPRDIIRLMILLQQNITPSVNVFDQKLFDAAQQEYSNRMWNELSEELRLSYSDEDIKAIKTFLTKLKLPFDYDYLMNRVQKMSEIYPEVKVFFDNHHMSDFLRKLFELGVIGNTGKRMVFYFLGDRDLSLMDSMVIHTPLRNFFAVESRNP